MQPQTVRVHDLHQVDERGRGEDLNFSVCVLVFGVKPCLLLLFEQIRCAASLFFAFILLLSQWCIWWFGSWSKSVSKKYLLNRGDAEIEQILNGAERFYNETNYV